MDKLIKLTKRETEVANLLAKGLTNRNIAAALFITVKTVETHNYHIYKKFNVSSRTALVSIVLNQNKPEYNLETIKEKHTQISEKILNQLVIFRQQSNEYNVFAAPHLMCAIQILMNNCSDKYIQKLDKKVLKLLY